MSRTLRIAALAAAAALALPAVAGPSWPPTPPRKPALQPSQATAQQQSATRALAPTPVSKASQSNDGFEYVGGDAGWQLAQHKYDFAGGRFTMSDECDHAIRSAQAATPAEVEAARRESPGA